MSIDLSGEWLWRLVDEALRVVATGPIEGFPARGVDCVGLAVRDLVWRHETEARVVVLLVLPAEELSAEGFGVRAAAKAVGEVLLVTSVS